ncbi:hypothetical protein DXG01_015365 [Tephrocybe rancida]|nr:hypothetical protein DXG01_015365 [Tephrocybe rancida]
MGQITFILRVAVQILAYTGPVLISLITLATVARVAPIDTHGIINRTVGASTATKATAKWIFGRLRHKHADPTPSSNLLVLLILSLLFTAFVSLTDIGFLGFYACSIPTANVIDAPASVSSNDAARALILTNMVNGTDPSKVKVARCDSSTVIDFGDNIFENNCTSWKNSTYADTELYANINSTDTDAMMPRQLTNYPSNAKISLNAFYVGPDTQRVTKPLIQKGLAVIPHDGGVQMVMGVPQLGPQKRVDLVKTLAVEVEVGCMTLGIRDIELIDTLSEGKMSFRTNGTWRNYTGPDYLEDALTKTVDDVRAYFEPFFNTSSLQSDGSMLSINASNLQLTTAAVVAPHQLPADFLSRGPVDELMGNCSQRVETKLGIVSDNRTTAIGDMCGLLGVGGSFSVEGFSAKIFERMVCATATQVNMVDATVTFDAAGKVSATITRVPSDLHYVIADYWSISISGLSNSTVFANYDPYRRYTLSENSRGSNAHFIHQPKLILNSYTVGLGSAGSAIASMGSTILGEEFFQTDEYNALGLLDDGLNFPQFHPPTVVKWMGQVGGSLMTASLGYNGWAALQGNHIEVQSTGGRLGSCYKPWYALGFVPLLGVVLLVVGWMVASMVGHAWFGTEVLEKGYGGVMPYAAAICPDPDNKGVLLAWEAHPEPRLQVIEKGYALTGGANATALKYLKSAPSYS